MHLRDWVTRNLRSGDLTALSAIAKGEANDGLLCERDRIGRLAYRGYVSQKRGRPMPAVTPLGRIALFVRRISM